MCIYIYSFLNIYFSLLAQVRIGLQCKRPGFDLCVRKTPGEENGNPFQYSCLESSMDRGTLSMGSQRVGHNWVTNTHTHTYFIYWFIYLDVPGLNCGLKVQLQHADSWLQHVGSSSLTRYRTHAPSIGSSESHLLDHQGMLNNILK